jgi:CRISPR-associated protein Csb2
MSLVLEIEFLSGVCFAAVGPDSGAADWPPQPDRVFSALVATWAARGCLDQERTALEWLEQQAVPELHASAYSERTPVVHFVPPNDDESGRHGNIGLLPERRRRQGRRFPAAALDQPVMRLVWRDVSCDSPLVAALDALARDTAYVGHSASLTRCRFHTDTETPDMDNAQTPQRRVYRGRLLELQRAYERYTASAGRRGRPLPGAVVEPTERPSAPPPCAFSGQWLILDHVAGDMPDIRAAALVGKTIRDALLAGYKRAGLESDIPEVVSGHAPDGTPSRNPHIAVIPLPFVGFPHADGAVMAFSLVPPAGSDVLRSDGFRRAMRAIARLDEERGRRVLGIRPREGGPPEGAFSLLLSPTFEPPAGIQSVRPSLYSAVATTFASVTPLVLDRHLKQAGTAQLEEIAAQIRTACRNIGLPEPVRVVPAKHSAFEGAPSAYPSANAPSWTRWQLPPSLRSRRLTHAVIVFAEPVAGPLILGAGRFLGMGLMRPLDGGAD